MKGSRVMTSLATGLFQLSSVVETLSGLAPVRKHLFRAGREILMAVHGLLHFADQYVPNLSLREESGDRIRGAINYAQKTVRLIADQLPREDEEEYRALKEKVIHSILEVLDAEMKGLGRKAHTKSSMKLEVLQAIRKVLVKETGESIRQKKGAL